MVQNQTKRPTIFAITPKELSLPERVISFRNDLTVKFLKIVRHVFNFLKNMLWTRLQHSASQGKNRADCSGGVPFVRCDKATLRSL